MLLRSNHASGRYFTARKADVASHKLRWCHCHFLNCSQSSLPGSYRNQFSSISHATGAKSQPPRMTSSGHPVKCDRMVYKIPITQIAGVKTLRIFCLLHLSFIISNFKCPLFNNNYYPTEPEFLSAHSKKWKDEEPARRKTRRLAMTRPSAAGSGWVMNVIGILFITLIVALLVSMFTFKD